MPIEEPPIDQGCTSCDGTGEMCAICGESSDVCECSEQEIQEYMLANDRVDNLDQCDDCDGTGK